jgi:hypothetical protein
MTEGSLVSLIALLGWLLLVVSGYRSYRAGPRKTMTYVLIWAALFGGVALVFGAMV